MSEKNVAKRRIAHITFASTLFPCPMYPYILVELKNPACKRFMQQQEFPFALRTKPDDPIKNERTMWLLQRLGDFGIDCTSKVLTPQPPTGREIKHELVENGERSGSFSITFPGCVHDEFSEF